MNKLMTFAAVAVSAAIPMAAFAENASMAATCAAAAEYTPEKWNIEARKRFAAHRYGVFIVGYKIGLDRFRPPEECVALIVRAAAKGANLLLNIGPDGSGQIPAKAVKVFEGIGRWFEKNGDSVYGTKAGGVSLGHQVVSTRKDDTLFIHFIDPNVEEFTFKLGGELKSVKCPRQKGDVSDVVVRFPLGGKKPEQYVVPGSRQTWKIVEETCKNPGNARLAVAEVDVF
jgi:hypothetical protein